MLRIVLQHLGLANRRDDFLDSNFLLDHFFMGMPGYPKQPSRCLGLDLPEQGFEASATDFSHLVPILSQTASNALAQHIPNLVL